MKKIIYLLIALLLINYAYAAVSGGSAGSTGGSEGGGGSSGTTESYTYFYGLKCYDSGKITFNQKPITQPVIAQKSDGTKFTVPGKWKGYAFSSAEAVITEPGTYLIYDAKNNNKSVECPELRFSCQLVNLSIQDCVYDAQKTTATIHLAGIGSSIDDLKFELQKPNLSKRFIYQKGKVASSEVKGLKIKEEQDNSYQLEIPIPLSQVKATYQNCAGDYYVSAKALCKEKMLSVKENTSETQQQKSLIVEKQEKSTISKIKSFFRSWYSG